MTRVIIAGSRDFNDFNLLCSACDRILGGTNSIEIVSGAAKGADALGEKYAGERGYTLVQFPADWDKNGRFAPFTRNKEMAEYANMLIVFWDGKSTGTKNMIKYAKLNGLEIHIIEVEKELNR